MCVKCVCVGKIGVKKNISLWQFGDRALSIMQCAASFLSSFVQLWVGWGLLACGVLLCW